GTNSMACAVPVLPPAAQVIRARALLAVAAGRSDSAAALLVGPRTGDPMGDGGSGFHREGVAAVVPRPGGGPPVRSGDAPPRRLLAAVGRPPAREPAGTSPWAVSTRQHRWRPPADG